MILSHAAAWFFFVCVGGIELARTRSKTKPAKSNESAAAPHLPDAERDVVACVWQKGDITAKEIREMIYPYRPMAHGSVVTLLTRLEAKGMVGKKKSATGREFIYRAAKKPEATYRRILKELVHRVFGGNSAAAMRSLLEARKPTKPELDDMSKMIDSARKGRKV
jgi:predicted transcriptional regulator